MEVLLYLPVPHRGYKEFFHRHGSADDFWIIGEPVISEFRHLRKNLPALTAKEVCSAVNSLGWTSSPVRIADHSDLASMNSRQADLFMPEDDVMLSVSERYLPQCNVIWDQTFLRWDKRWAEKKIDPIPDCVISANEWDREIMGYLEAERYQSGDFWRQVSGAIVRNREILFTAHNQHLPDPENPYFYGDPRSNFSRGLSLELSTAEHCEARLIGQCARQGIATEGLSIYVTTFPCPPCAKLIARAGFAKCFFAEGYSILDSETILKNAGVELIQVI